MKIWEKILKIVEKSRSASTPSQGNPAQVNTKGLPHSLRSQMARKDVNAFARGDKVHCLNCAVAILPQTFLKNEGRCVPCNRGLAESRRLRRESAPAGLSEKQYSRYLADTIRAKGSSSGRSIATPKEECALTKNLTTRSIPLLREAPALGAIGEVPSDLSSGSLWYERNLPAKAIQSGILWDVLSDIRFVEPGPVASLRAREIAQGSFSQMKGKSFEGLVEVLLRAVEQAFPKRVLVTPQAKVRLYDGRTKIVDFAFDYTSVSSRHQVAIECQDRSNWSTEIVDKILAIRNQSHRNRFWFVYNDEEFLSEEAKNLLKKHGVLFFSLAEFQRHLREVAIDLWGSILAESIKMETKQEKYDPPSDAAMVSR